MADAPDVSVVVPTKDRWALLSRNALRSALGQRSVELEVIVVDDGSRDETPERLAELATADRRVRVVRHDHPRGVSAARNAGIEAARAPWVAFLDDDDVWSPRKLEAQLAAAGRAGAAWAYAGAIAVDETGGPLYEYYFPEPVQVARQLLASAVVPAGASNVVVRTDLVRRLGGFDEAFLHLEDWDLWIRLAESGDSAAVREVLVAVLFHSQNKHAVSDQAEELDRLIRKHAGLTPPRRLTVDRHGHARWVASQHSRSGLHRRAAWLYLRAAVQHRSPTDLGRAADALLGKRISSVAGRRRPILRPVAQPAWLTRQPFDEVPIR